MRVAVACDAHMRSGAEMPSTRGRCAARLRLARARKSRAFMIGSRLVEHMMLVIPGVHQLRRVVQILATRCGSSASAAPATSAGKSSSALTSSRSSGSTSASKSMADGVESSTRRSRRHGRSRRGARAPSGCSRRDSPRTARARGRCRRRARLRLAHRGRSSARRRCRRPSRDRAA